MIEVLPRAAGPIDSTLQPLADQVLASLRHHLGLMGLDAWDIKILWTAIPGQYAMQTNAEPEYYKATIEVDLDDLKPEAISSYIRHELFHIILWQYTEAATSFALKRTKTTLNRLEERTVSDLERMPLWESLPSSENPSLHIDK
jgi:hypothetical protein